MYPSVEGKTKMTTQQTATPAPVDAVVQAAADSLRGAASFLNADRESAGIGNIRWSRRKLVEGGCEASHPGALGMIDAAIKAFDQGNDRRAADFAMLAADRLV